MGDQKNNRTGGFNSPFRDKFGPSSPPRPAVDRADATLDDIWPGYLAQGYFKEGFLVADYVRRDRILPLVRAFAAATPPLTNHQLRRFFQHCRAVEARLKRNSGEWPQLEVEFRRLDMAAADAFGKKDRKIPKIFHDFIAMNSRTVQGKDDFLKGFIPHFEAVVGFSSGILRERDRS